MNKTTTNNEVSPKTYKPKAINIEKLLAYLSKDEKTKND